MKRLLVLVLGVFLALTLAVCPAFATQAVIGLSISGTGEASGTSDFSVSTINSDTLTRMLDSNTGSDFYIVKIDDVDKSPCWSVQVTTATTTGGSSTFDLGYKVLTTTSSTTPAWTLAPLIRTNKGTATSSSGYNPVYFNPPPGSYIRFYWTHDPTGGTTPFITVDATVLVTDNANCAEPEVIRLGVENLTLNTSGVSSFSEPADAKETWVTLMGGPFRFTDSSVSGTSVVGQIYYDKDSLFFYGKNDIDGARFMLDSTATSGGSMYILHYGRP